MYATIHCVQMVVLVIQHEMAISHVHVQRRSLVKIAECEALMKVCFYCNWHIENNCNIDIKYPQEWSCTDENNVQRQHNAQWDTIDCRRCMCKMVRCQINIPFTTQICSQKSIVHQQNVTQTIAYHQVWPLIIKVDSNVRRTR